MKLTYIITLVPFLAFSQLTQYNTVFEKKGTLVEVQEVTNDDDNYFVFNFRYRNRAYETFVDMGGFSFLCKSEVAQFADDIDLVANNDSDDETLRRKKYWISQSKETPNQITIWDDYDRYYTISGRMINATVRDLRASLDYWTKDREYCL